MNKEKCALKLVDEIILYYDVRSKKHHMYSIIAVTNKHTAKLHHVGSLYILTYDARKLEHKNRQCNYKRSIEVRSSYYFCCGKAISITCSECMS